MSSSRAVEKIDASLTPTEKEQRILEAVKNNDIDSLKTLVNSFGCFKIKNESGKPAVAIAIIEQCNEIFDNLLSLSNYSQEDLDAALSTCLDSVHFVSSQLYPYPGEHFVCELIERGADVHQQGLLHNALGANWLKAAECLLKKGVDANQFSSCDGRKIPLDIICWTYLIVDDPEKHAIPMLMFYGADPITHYCKDEVEVSILEGILVNLDLPLDNKSITAEDFFMDYIFGVYTDYDINMYSFLKATKLKDCIFYEICQNTREVYITNISKDYFYIQLLFSMKTDFLRIIIEKFDHVVKELLTWTTCVSFVRHEPILVENLNVLMNSHLAAEVAEWLDNYFDEGFVTYFIGTGCDLLEVEKLTCFLLSHGLGLTQNDLETVYRKFGYCEFFKILLHMDVNKQSFYSFYDLQDIIPYILYKVTLDVPKMLVEEKDMFPDSLSIGCDNNLIELLPYYTIPVDLLENCGLRKMHEQRRVPLLLELARNVFRRFFIQRFKIKKASQFYTLVKRLPITNYHKQIITLEAKLY